MSKILVAYFSHAGFNFSQGKIIDLKVGNTAVVAQKLAIRTGGDLFEISTKEDYPSDYNSCVERAKNEFTSNKRPTLKQKVKDMKNYDTIFLGFPNWCGTMPMPVWTFLENYDFSDKRLIPFITHEGSGFARSIMDIQKLLPASTILEGQAILGHEAETCDPIINSWLTKLGISR